MAQGQEDLRLKIGECVVQQIANKFCQELPIACASRSQLGRIHRLGDLASFYEKEHPREEKSLQFEACSGRQS